MFTVYSCTYLAANVTERVCKDAGIDHTKPTAIITSVVNIVAISWKDFQFAKYMQHAVKSFSPMSYGLFALRDGATIVSSFVLKYKLSDKIMQSMPGVKRWQADLFSSLAAPMSAQLVSTPLHILGMDMFSKPQSTWSGRMVQIRQSYTSVCIGR